MLQALDFEICAGPAQSLSDKHIAAVVILSRKRDEQIASMKSCGTSDEDRVRLLLRRHGRHEVFQAFADPRVLVGLLDKRGALVVEDLLCSVGRRVDLSLPYQRREERWSDHGTTDDTDGVHPRLKLVLQANRVICGRRSQVSIRLSGSPPTGLRTPWSFIRSKVDICKYR